MWKYITHLLKIKKVNRKVLKVYWYVFFFVLPFEKKSFFCASISEFVDNPVSCRLSIEWPLLNDYA